MIGKFAIAALGAAAVLGLGTSHSANAQPIAEAVNDITDFQIATAGFPATIAGTSFTYSFALTAPPPHTQSTLNPEPFVGPTFTGSFAESFYDTTASIAQAGADTSAGNPFVISPSSALALYSEGMIDGCCGYFGTSNIIQIYFTQPPHAGSVTFMFTDSIALIAESTSPTMTFPTGTCAFALVSNTFDVLNLTTPSKSVNYSPSDINVGIGACSGAESTLALTEFFQSTAVLDKGDSYEIYINIDPEGGTTVFEPSSILMLGSGLAGLCFAARRKPPQLGFRR
jgi:hypothetical protein